MGRLQKLNAVSVFQQKGIDVLLSVDLVRLSWSNKIDKAILVTADSDFVPAIAAAKDAGVLVEVFYSPKQPMSNELLQACNDRSVITKDLVEDSLIVPQR